MHQFSLLMVNLHYTFLFYSVLTRPRHCSIAALFREMPHYIIAQGVPRAQRRKTKQKKNKTLWELSFRHAFYLIRVVRVADTSRSRRLACLRSHVLRAYRNFESKQAISITLFGRRPSKKNIRKH